MILCYTRSYLSTLEVQHDEVLYKSTLLYFTLCKECTQPENRENKEKWGKKAKGVLNQRKTKGMFHHSTCQVMSSPTENKRDWSVV